MTTSRYFLLLGLVSHSHTSAGIGEIEAGQTVEISIEGIGILTNSVA